MQTKKWLSDFLVRSRIHCNSFSRGQTWAANENSLILHWQGCIRSGLTRRSKNY